MLDLKKGVKTSFKGFNLEAWHTESCETHLERLTVIMDTSELNKYGIDKLSGVADGFIASVDHLVGGGWTRRMRITSSAFIETEYIKDESTLLDTWSVGEVSSEETGKLIISLKNTNPAIFGDPNEDGFAWSERRLADLLAERGGLAIVIYKLETGLDADMSNLVREEVHGQQSDSLH